MTAEQIIARIRRASADEVDVIADATRDRAYSTIAAGDPQGGAQLEQLALCLRQIATKKRGQDQ